jgi:hypothetical protein
MARSRRFTVAPRLTYFQVWAYQVARGSVRVGDPVDLSQRLDNQWNVYTERFS